MYAIMVRQDSYRNLFLWPHVPKRFDRALGVCKQLDIQFVSTNCSKGRRCIYNCTRYDGLAKGQLTVSPHRVWKLGAVAVRVRVVFVPLHTQERPSLRSTHANTAVSRYRHRQWIRSASILDLLRCLDWDCCHNHVHEFGLHGECAGSLSSQPCRRGERRMLLLQGGFRRRGLDSEAVLRLWSRGWSVHSAAQLQHGLLHMHRIRGHHCGTHTHRREPRLRLVHDEWLLEELGVRRDRHHIGHLARFVPTATQRVLRTSQIGRASCRERV